MWFLFENFIIWSLWTFDIFHVWWARLATCSSVCQSLRPARPWQEPENETRAAVFKEKRFPEIPWRHLCWFCPSPDFNKNNVELPHLGDSMSKVREKRSTSKSRFFYEMWMIIRQLDDFDRFMNNFWNFGLF